MDPIAASGEELIDSLRQFDEKFGIETFVTDYLKCIKKQNLDLLLSTLKKYTVLDEVILRARTFIMNCFDLESE